MNDTWGCDERYHISNDPLLQPYLDGTISNPFMERNKLSFRQRRDESPARSRGRDKLLNERRFGSSPTVNPDKLQDSLTSLNISSRPSQHRSFGFSDYSSPPVHGVTRSQSNTNQSQGSPMEVDYGSPEIPTQSHSSPNLQGSSSMFSSLWSTAPMKFVPSPKSSDIIPNPFSVQRTPSRQTQQTQETVRSIEEDPDVIDLSRDEDSENKKNYEGDNVEKTSLSSSGSLRSVCVKRSSSEVGEGFSSGKRLSSAEERRSKCLYVKYVCYFNLFILFLIVVGLMGLHVAGQYSERRCQANQQLNLTAISHSWHEMVYGQHIAYETVTRALEDFVSTQRAMVLSFHGWTGIGKTFVSTLIGNHVRTPSVYRFFIPQHFSHVDEDDVYEMRIQEWIRSNITACGVNVFIIDEMDKATVGTTAGLVSVLQDIKEMELNNTRVLVILISNTGGKAINDFTFRHLQSGYEREKLLGSGLVAGILNDADADWLQTLNDAGVVDYIVPFLPLERSHLKLCVEAYIRSSKLFSLDDIDMDKVLDDFTYLPRGYPLFSKSGCRQVSSKVNIMAHFEEPGVKVEL